ncbi:hypothetical protein Zm00014a_036479 [Zea mays]|jgi:hypothetical protein|uniref:Uncharacterized protein n=1 Tax=Zea mays TaxID=4577 RepID=A0A3L6FVB4_MAIZE|nr:hypothetical protein Zm00014a_036479 [Zea mays]
MYKVVQNTVFTVDVTVWRVEFEIEKMIGELLEIA